MISDDVRENRDRSTHRSNGDHRRNGPGKKADDNQTGRHTNQHSGNKAVRHFVEGIESECPPTIQALVRAATAE